MEITGKLLTVHTWGVVRAITICNVFEKLTGLIQHKTNLLCNTYKVPV